MTEFKLLELEGIKISGLFFLFLNFTILFSFKLPTNKSPFFVTVIPSGKKLSSNNKIFSALTGI